jgi:hypothetical protein
MTGVYCLGVRGQEVKFVFFDLIKSSACERRSPCKKPSA